MLIRTKAWCDINLRLNCIIKPGETRQHITGSNIKFLFAYGNGPNPNLLDYFSFYSDFQYVYDSKGEFYCEVVFFLNPKSKDRLGYYLI